MKTFSIFYPLLFYPSVNPLVIFLLIIFFMVGLPSFAEKKPQLEGPHHEKAGFHIFIDPGHGGIDSGAQSGTIRESDLSLKISLMVRDLLLHQGPSRWNPIQVTLSRTKDAYLRLEDRIEMVERVHPDIFISIHANASPEERSHGVEFYFQNHLPPEEDTYYITEYEDRLSQNPRDLQKLSEGTPVTPTAGGKSLPSTETFFRLSKRKDLALILEDFKRQNRNFESFRLSRSLLMGWRDISNTPNLFNTPKPGEPEIKVGSGTGSETLEKNSRKQSKLSTHIGRGWPRVSIHQAPFRVVSKTTVPAVLIELGYLTNPQEAERLNCPEEQAAIAERIFAGLMLFR